MHTIIQPYKKILKYYYGGKLPYSSVCELHGSEEEDVSPCSHFDHCERPAVIWLYDKDGAPAVYGLCNQCYAYNHPTTDYWYRVVKVSQDFTGKL